MIRRHPILFGLLLLVVVGIAVLIIRHRMPKPLLVRMGQVEREETLKSVVSAPGEIRAHEMVDIQTEIPGVIIDLPVKEGQSVKKGDVLLRIDPLQASAEVAGARARHISGAAEIERIDAQIGGAQANLARQREEIKSLEADLAETQIMHDRDLSALKRQVDLVKDKTISAEEFEVAEAKAKASAQHIESARARIQQAKADLRAGQMTVEQLRAAKAIAEQDRAVSKSALDRAQDQLSKVTITSPLDGVIAQLNVDVGERAVPGIQSNPEANLMTIANMSTIEAEIEADESDIVRVALGQPCEVDVDALPDTPLKAHVTEIGNMPIRKQTTSQEGKDFKVVVMLDDPPKSLRVGMSCEAKITVGVHNNVLAAPIQALTTREVGVDEKGAYAPPPRPAKPGKGISSQSAGAATPKGGKEQSKKTKELQGVFVKDAGNLAHFRPVKTGLMGETQVEIVDGLKEGEEVITGPLNALRTLEEWKLVKKTDIIKEE